MLFGGRQLEEEQRLDACGVSDDSQLYILMRLLGGAKKRKKKTYTKPKKQKHKCVALGGGGGAGQDGSLPAGICRGWCCWALLKSLDGAARRAEVSHSSGGGTGTPPHPRWMPRQAHPSPRPCRRLALPAGTRRSSCGCSSSTRWTTAARCSACARYAPAGAGGGGGGGRGGRRWGPGWKPRGFGTKGPGPKDTPAPARPPPRAPPPPPPPARGRGGGGGGLLGCLLWGTCRQRGGFEPTAAAPSDHRAVACLAPPCLRLPHDLHRSCKLVNV